MIRQPLETRPISDEAMAGLRTALTAVATLRSEPVELTKALTVFCAEGHAHECLPEQLVLVLKDIWRRTPRPVLVELDKWDAMYETALTTMLRLYFHGSAR
jgi:hypothetical protein